MCDLITLIGSLLKSKLFEIYQSVIVEFYYPIINVFL